MNDNKTKKNGLVLLFNRFSGLVNDKAINSLLSRMVQSVADIAVSFVNSVSSFTTYSFGLFTMGLSVAGQAALTLAGMAGATAMMQAANDPENRSENKEIDDQASTKDLAKELGVDLSDDKAKKVDQAIEQASDETQQAAQNIKKSISGGSINNQQDLSDSINEQSEQVVDEIVTLAVDVVGYEKSEVEQFIEPDLPPELLSVEALKFNENENVIIKSKWRDHAGFDFYTEHEFGVFDFENGQNKQSVAIDAEGENGLKMYVQIDFTIENVNEAPTLSTQTSLTGKTYTVDLTATDPDQGDNITFYVNGVEMDKITFTVDDLINGLDDFHIVSIDDGGLSDEITVSPPELSDTPGNDAPIFLGLSQSNVNENAATTIKGLWYDTEDGYIETDIFIPSFNYERTKSYPFKTSFTDSDGETVTESASVSINNVNESPYFTRAFALADDVTEPTRNYFVLDDDARPDEAPLFAVEFNDPENNIVRFTASTSKADLTLYRSGNQIAVSVDDEIGGRDEYTHKITFKAYDQYGLFDSQIIYLEVLGV